ncbi:MAG: Crp/Fnr family transcriptional regulator [Flavobacterium sp.]|nr:MAG: Crp/Fnr family transcriptional regulator [Flavobacterium sp.]
MEIDALITRIYNLPEASAELLKSYITEEAYPKGHILLREGRLEQYIYFIRSGIARAYSETGNGEVTFWFGSEGDTVVSMKSYVANEEGYENIELLENSKLFAIETASLRKLFETDIHIANWGRKFAEYELVKTEQRLIDLQVLTATERYRKLIAENPRLLQRVQLSHIASYLGITPGSFSRIRAELK